MKHTTDSIRNAMNRNGGQIPSDVLADLLATRKLLGADTNAKTAKGRAKGFATFILYMAPADLSGFQMCPMATKGCAAACLNTAGRGRMDGVQISRIWKAQAFHRMRPEFMTKLDDEICRARRWAERKGLTPVFRLNGTTDVRWESIPVPDEHGPYRSIMTAHPDVQFYDYTKLPNRRNLPPNYHLTFSYSGANGAHAQNAIRQGLNVAVVFRSREVAESAMQAGISIGSQIWPAVDGDADDLRFLDGRGQIVALYAKGDAKRDLTGFVVDHGTIPVHLPAVTRASLACVAA